METARNREIAKMYFKKKRDILVFWPAFCAHDLSLFSRNEVLFLFRIFPAAFSSMWHVTYALHACFENFLFVNFRNVLKNYFPFFLSFPQPPKVRAGHAAQEGRDAGQLGWPVNCACAKHLFVGGRPLQNLREVQGGARQNHQQGSVLQGDLINC